jgi:ribosomal protein L19
MEAKISTIVEESYKRAIPVVNKRTIPNFKDGLKPVQLRIIYTAIKIALKNKTKVSEIIGYCMSNYHPYGDQSMYDVVVDLANKGILKSQGNFGKKHLWNKDDDPAAPRYIEAGISQAFAELVNTLIKYCKLEDSEGKAGVKIPETLILPIPIAAITGSIGIGQAANTCIPAFTAKSLLAAMKANDYHLLKSSFGAEIVPDKSNLRKIWEKGHGKITYRMKVYKGEFSGLQGVFMEGNPILFNKTRDFINKTFWRKIKEDLVVVYDVKDKVFIGKQYNVRKIDVDYIYNKCMEIRDYTQVYMITVIKDGVVRRAPLYNWIYAVYHRYLKYYERYINDKINEKNAEAYLLGHLKEIGERFAKDQSDKQIMKEMQIPQWCIDAAEKKSLGALRRDHTNEIKKLKSEVSELKKVNIVESVDKLINKL